MASREPQDFHPLLGDSKRPEGVRCVVTGQVGLDKKSFLRKVVDYARSKGKTVSTAHIGERMYAEAPDVQPGRILDLPKTRLHSLRRSVFKDVIAQANQGGNLIVNTHATFRWKHGLFHAFDHADMVRLDADLYITLIDNLDAVHERLKREHDLQHTLKDILVWREEEMVVTRAMAEALGKVNNTYFIAIAGGDAAVRAFYQLMFEPQRRRVYPSFPMTHVMDMPDTLAEINEFRRQLAEYFIAFDPGDMDEKDLLFKAGHATSRGEETITMNVGGRDVTLRAADVAAVAPDIDAQIYARDFMMIDQSHMIVSFVPALRDGKPAISSGVERELQHAYEGTREVYVVWAPKSEPSPFITGTATLVVRSLDELFAEFKRKGYIQSYQPNLKGLSASQS
jgi:adenylate kinase